MNDEELLCAWLQGNLEAGDSLVQRYYPVVYGRCLRQLDSNLAQDACQAVFMILVDKKEGLTDHPMILGWLMRTCDYVILNAKRDRMRRNKREMAIKKEEEIEYNKAALDSNIELPISVDEVITTLPKQERDLVELHFYLGKSYSEISNMCHLAKSTVGARVMRGVERMRIFYKKKGVQISTTILLLLFQKIHATMISQCELSQVETRSISEGTLDTSKLNKLMYSTKARVDIKVLSLVISLPLLVAFAFWLFLVNNYKSAIDLYMPVNSYGILGVVPGVLHESRAFIYVSDKDHLFAKESGMMPDNHKELPVYSVKLKYRGSDKSADAGLIFAQGIGLEVPDEIIDEVAGVLPMYSFQESGVLSNSDLEKVNNRYIPIQYVVSNSDSYIKLTCIRSVDLLDFVQTQIQATGNLKKWLAIQFDIGAGRVSTSFDVISDVIIGDVIEQLILDEHSITGNA